MRRAPLNYFQKFSSIPFSRNEFLSLKNATWARENVTKRNLRPVNAPIATCTNLTGRSEWEEGLKFFSEFFLHFFLQKQFLKGEKRSANYLTRLMARSFSKIWNARSDKILRILLIRVVHCERLRTKFDFLQISWWISFILIHTIRCELSYRSLKPGHYEIRRIFHLILYIGTL